MTYSINLKILVLMTSVVYFFIFPHLNFEKDTFDLLFVPIRHFCVCWLHMYISACLLCVDDGM